MTVVALEPAKFLAMFSRLSPGDAANYLVPFDAACTEFEINTSLRLAAFAAQLAHESGDLTQWLENLNYSSSRLLTVWPTRFNSQVASEYAGNPVKIANRVYANRMGNGDESSGDGWRYRGRGPIQLTGRANYKAAGDALNLDLEDNPDQVATPEVGLRVAAWYWKDRGCNDLADARNFREITRRINGGMNGYPGRLKKYKANMSLLGIA